MAEEGAVLAPGEAIGEEVGRAVVLAGGLHAVAALAEESLDRFGAAGVGKARAVVGTLEISIGDGYLGALDGAPGGAETADRADRDGDDDEHPEPVEPGGMEDVEEAKAVHRAGKGTVRVLAERHPGRTGRGVAAHRRGNLRDDDADEPRAERKAHEEERELHVGQQVPHRLERVETGGLDVGALARARDGAHRSLAAMSSSWVSPRRPK